MKTIPKIACNKITLLIICFFYIATSYSQLHTDMIKYWYYRDRLNKYFVVPGENHGESQIICVRNRIFDINDNETSKNFDFGQHGIYTGYYLGVLATEYYLLKSNMQTNDTENTLKELYLALRAFEFYMDYKAEDFYGFDESSNGFFVRENVPCLFLDYNTTDNKNHKDLLNWGLNEVDNDWDPQTLDFGNPKGHPGYVTHKTGCDSSHNFQIEAMSMDEAIGVMMGLALTIKCTADHPIYNNIDVNSFAKNLYNLIVRYIINLDKIYGDDKWRIYQPSAGRNQYVPAGEDTYYLGKGIIKAGYAMIGSANFGTYDFSQDFYWWVTQDVIPNKKINLTMVAMLGALGNAWTHTGFVLNKICSDIDWKIESFYILLWEVLHNKKLNNDNEQNALLKKALAQLDAGPCEGPYCYVPMYNDDGSINNNNPVTSGNGWGSTYRWQKELIFQENGDWFTGNYSGLDYMLLHNLYYIVTKHDNLNYFVNYVDKQVGVPAPIQLSAFGAAHGTDNSPLNFIGFNSIVSTQLINDDIIHLYPYNPPPNSTPQPGNVTYKAQNTIKLKPGFHAKAGCYFHAYIEDIDCNEEGSKSISQYPDNVITMVYDSLVSVAQTPYPLTIDDDTTEVVFTDTLACPIDTIRFTGITGDTIEDVFSYYWDFGNGQTSTLKTPKVYYNTAGNYDFMLVLTDTNNITDTIRIKIVVPDCGGSIIKGHLYQHAACGGAPVAGDTLVLKNNGAAVQGITPAITQADGSFAFLPNETALLDPVGLYTIEAQSNTGITEMQPRTPEEWEQLSPMDFYFTTLVSQEWVAKYSGIDSLGAMATTMDINGNLYIAGATLGSTTQHDYLVVKYNPGGDIQWTASYNGPADNYDIVRAIVVDSDENVYVTGESYNNAGGSNVVTIKYNAAGTQLWCNTFSSAVELKHNAFLIKTDDAGVVVEGNVLNNGTSNDCLVIKYLASGQFFGSGIFDYMGGNDIMTALNIDTAGNIYLSGYGEAQQGMYNVVTIKFDPYGNFAWLKSYYSGINNSDFDNSSTLDKQGNIIVTCTSKEITGRERIKTIKYAPDGNIIWETDYTSPDMNYTGKFVMTDSLDNIYVCSQACNNDKTSWFFVAVKYDSSGNELWAAKYAFNEHPFNYLNSATTDAAGNIYLCGITAAVWPAYDYMTVKISADGIFQWARTYNEPGSNSNNAVKVLAIPDGNVYVTGTCYKPDIYETLTIKYGQCPSLPQNKKLSATETNTGNNNTLTYQPDDFKVNIMPNPYRHSTTIDYILDETSQVLMEVYTITGQKICALIQSTQEAGAYRLLFSAQKLGFTPGIYILRVKINGAVMNYRLVEMKN